VTVALGLTTALMWALTDLCNLVMTRRAGPYAGAFWLLACGIVPLVPAALLAEDWPAHVPLDALAAAIVAGVLDGIAVVCLLRALAVGSLALVAPLAALEGGVAALGAVALGADTTLLVGVGLALAVAGGALASAVRDEDGVRRRADGAGWALLSALAFGTVLLLLDPATELGNLNATLVLRIAATLALVPLALHHRVLRLDLGIGRIALLAGTLDAVGFAIYAAAADRGPLSVAAVCAAQFATFAAVIGLVVLKERLQPRQLLGIVVTLVGVTVLATQ
jgi:drug/metabolite transporter (DMT)-like permease